MITAIFFQIFIPHFGLIVNSIKMGILRCWDRRCTCNKRITRQITQEEYEDLYSGPPFILQLRFSQVLSMIFVTMTYSSGLPILYLVAFLSLFITYWTDKFLMLRYFRVANQFTEELSKTVTNILPWAGIFHFIFGYFFYSYPFILKSGLREEASAIEGGSRYFSNQRMGQTHIVLFIVAFALVILMLIFEKPIVALLSLIAKGVSIGLHKLWNCIRCKEQTPYVDENDEVIDAPDYYYEINFAQLCKEYKIQKMERQKFTKLKDSEHFTHE